MIDNGESVTVTEMSWTQKAATKEESKNVFRLTKLLDGITNSAVFVLFYLNKFLFNFE